MSRKPEDRVRINAILICIGGHQMSDYHGTSRCEGV